MKTVVWITIVICVVVAAFWGLERRYDIVLDRELEALSLLEEPQETIDAAVDFLEKHPDADLERMNRAVEQLANAAYAGGDVDGVLSVLDSLAALALPAPAKARMSAEVHDALVMATLMAPESADVGRANSIARRLIGSGDLPSESYRMMASLRSDILADADASTHWTTVALAHRACDTATQPEPGYCLNVLDSAYRALLGHIAGNRSLERALAVADSVAADFANPLLSAVLNANKYRVAAADEPELALEFARAFVTSGDVVDHWRLPNRIGVDIRNRELDYGLALELSEWALTLARTDDDRQVVLSSIGWAEHKLGREEDAKRHLEASMALLRGAPEMDDSAVERLLSVYEATGDNESAIDLLATIVARSVLPNEDARDELRQLLVESDRNPREMPDLIAERRYARVSPAPALTVAYADGRTIELEQLRGSVVVLCFWSYG